jgi:LPXTG-site transpeptidase (sortase) family protein
LRPALRPAPRSAPGPASGPGQPPRLPWPPRPPVEPDTEYIAIDAETEYIHHVGPEYDDHDYDDQDYDDHYDADEQADDDRDARHGRTRPPVEPGRGGSRAALRTLGEVLVTAGMVVLLFVVYEVYITGIFAAQKQASATSALDKEWDTVPGSANQLRVPHYDLTDGHGIAKLYIPALGQDYHFTIVEGTTDADLAIGPGHYIGSALPGQPGDFAVAGHRVGEGAPFNDLDLVQSCDSIVVETSTDWYVYRMLPKTTEVADWTSTKGAQQQCSGVDGEAKVAPLGGQYRWTVGQEVVYPSEGDVVAPIPHVPTAHLSPVQEASLLTLTTCTPKFSASQRLIVHAVLVKDWQKDQGNPNQPPPELRETS